MQLDIYVYFFPSLEDVDVTDQQFTFLTILYMFLAALLVYSLICLASFSSSTFRSLSGVDKFTWCAKATKVLYFPLPILTGYWYLLVDDSLSKDVVNGTTKTSYISIYIYVGYIIFDCILMAIGKLLYFKTFSNTLFLHHFVALIIYSTVLYYNGKLHYIAMLVFIGEKPGPISYMNWIMGKAKLTHLFIWNISQSFAVYLWYTRSVVELYFLYLTFINWDSIMKNVPTPFLVIYFGSAAILIGFFTPYWTRLEAKRLFRVINKDKTS